MEKDYEMIDGEKIFKALKLGKVTGLGCTLTSAECGFLIAHNDALTQYINHLENPEPEPPEAQDADKSAEYTHEREVKDELLAK